ncbi:F420-dependent glucose-6-phosphate dehydrogenase [Streptomyces sp. RB5]|uniref:F420-dependent glucose-6-phosphate dehydrogenase n=1 Tax=Streptomyces smaragdinus TaxID=2585196 RepID=A0A7K0CRU5_9ACTN|nr:LLM class flavin-dependent oxidoreductase [Streptomyces smaragdinus]MQY16161.1 F420-dependent glucose-6-phosphate dehydrogenase [Streptomyces smaragdinus]
MQIGVNVPNFGPAADPGLLRDWAQTVEGLGFDLLTLSDHVAVTPDVAEQYPAPFHEPFTALAWLAGVTRRVRLGTSVLIAPYRHPLLTARMAANVGALSGGRLVLGVGVGWARQEFAALGVPFGERGRLTDEVLAALRRARTDPADYAGGDVPLWVGGNSAAGLRRAVRHGDAWHPLRATMPWLVAGHARLRAAGADVGFAPRIALRLTPEPLPEDGRLAGEGSLGQVRGDLDRLRDLGAEAVVLDPLGGGDGGADVGRPQPAWQALAAVAAARTNGDNP